MERRRNGADGFLIAKGRKGMLIFWGQDRRDLSLRDRTSDVMDRLYKNANEAFFFGRAASAHGFASERRRPMAVLGDELQGGPLRWQQGFFKGSVI